MALSRRRIITTTSCISILGFSTIARASGSNRRRRPIYEILSPNGKLKLNINTTGNFVKWSVSLGNKQIIRPSELGLLIKDGILGVSAEIMGHTINKYTGSWAPSYGQSSVYDKTSNEIIINFENRLLGIRYNIIFRIFNNAVAVRYELVNLSRAKELKVISERTQFRFLDNARVYSSRDEGDIHVSSQRNVAPLEHPDLTSSSDKLAFADLPLTIDAGNGLYAFIAEADRMHYPRCAVRSNSDGYLVTYLMRYPGRATGWGGQDETHEEAEFSIEIGQKTPWRVVMVANSAKELIEMHSIVPTLATPNQLGNTAWVKPGKSFRIMKPYSTEASLKAVDFAAERRIEYVLFDAHWYGDGTDASEPTKPISNLNLQMVIDYAKTKNIGVLLYIDRVAVTKSLDDICKLYQAWGVAGVKLGFMWEGRQSDVDFIYKVVKAFGDHKMIVNLHDNLRPAGLETTLPNYLTLEGVKGNEQFPPARHNVNLAFTRPIAGPIDYTICYAQERNQTTNAHQLALAVTCYSPLQTLYWYDKPEKYQSKPWPELAWFDNVPTIWDETKAIAGELGEYVIIARRKADEWFVGAITNEMERRLNLDLSFLGEGNWIATRYIDGKLTRPANKTPVNIDTIRVTSSSRIHLQLNAAGGQAIHIKRG